MTTTTEVKRRVHIFHDEDSDGPREWSNVGTMVCWHKRYTLGDEQPDENNNDWLRTLAGEWVDTPDPDLIPDEHVWRILAKHFVMLPLYLYDHSGITMSTGPFSCPWDSGQVGWIYCTTEKAREEWDGTDKEIAAQAEKYLVGEVEVYDQFIRGEVYGYVCEVAQECDECGNIKWEEVDSCWGFYGDEVKESGMLDHMPDEFHELAKEAEVTYL